VKWLVLIAFAGVAHADPSPSADMAAGIGLGYASPGSLVSVLELRVAVGGAWPDFRLAGLGGIHGERGPTSSKVTTGLGIDASLRVAPDWWLHALVEKPFSADISVRVAAGPRWEPGDGWLGLDVEANTPGCVACTAYGVNVVLNVGGHGDTYRQLVIGILLDIVLVSASYAL